MSAVQAKPARTSECDVDWPGRVAALEAQIDRLRAEMDGLKAAARRSTLGKVPLCLGLTAQEARVLSALCERHEATKEQLMAAVYEAHDDAPALKIVDVFICKIRRKALPYGVTIRTIWGRGYALDGKDRQRLQALAAEERAA
jgi:DNA-binding response OmpR family regulator